MNRKLFASLLACGLLLGCAPQSQSPDPIPAPTPAGPFSADSIGPGEHHAYTFAAAAGEMVPYWLYLPEGYDDNKDWPLLLFLHGFIGNDPVIDDVLPQTPPALLGEGVALPMIVLSPQASVSTWSTIRGPIDELIRHLSRSIAIDSQAQYLAGLSNSTQAIWNWALVSPGRFRGIVVVAGTASAAGLTEEVCVLQDLPIWIAHGETDETPINSHQIAASELQACGSTTMSFTVYPELGHFPSIERAFAGPELYQWLLAQPD